MSESMSLYTSIGDEVVFTGEGVNEKENRLAKLLLEVDRRYMVAGISIGDYGSSVKILGYGNLLFGTSMFKNVDKNITISREME